MRAMRIIIGGVIGVLIVRGWHLNFVQEIGWRMFWNGVESGDHWCATDTVLHSATFAKCVVGFVIGGLIFELLWPLLWRRGASYDFELPDDDDDYQLPPITHGRFRR